MSGEVELRWVVPESTTTEAPKLQYRHTPSGFQTVEDPWQTVPTVVVPRKPAKVSPQDAAIIGLAQRQRASLKQVERRWDAVEHLDDFEMTVYELQQHLQKLSAAYGPSTLIRTNGGHNNVQIEVSVK